MDEAIKQLNKQLASNKTELKRQQTLITNLENSNKKIIEQNKYLNEQNKKLLTIIEAFKEELQSLKNNNINIKNKDKLQDDQLIKQDKRISKLEEILKR